MRQIQLSFTTILNQIPAYAYSLNDSLNTTLENLLSQVEIDQLKEKKIAQRSSDCSGGFIDFIQTRQVELLSKRPQSTRIETSSR